jgi:predicted ATPase
VFLGWTRARLGDSEIGVTELRQALAALSDQGNKLWLPFFQSLLAEIEAETVGTEGALTRIGEALALAGETGEQWSDALLHRIHGEILWKRDSANTAPAEEAFLTAIAIAQQQKAKSFELRAALALAKLYQSTNRPADAHAALAPALEGFSPTPEFPEIEEALALLAALAETDEVKNAALSRQRRLKLQTSYGRAAAWSRGFGAEETKTAFTRAQELATGIDNADERFATYYGVWVGSLLRGELRSARETAETFRREAENEARTNEAAVACRYLGLTCLCQGDFIEAQANLVEALRIYDPERDREAKFRFGIDTGAGARAYLANISWLLGELGQARELVEEALARAVQSGHIPTQTTVYYQATLFEMLRGDAEATKRTAETLVKLSQEHSIALYLTGGALSCAWARARRGDRETGVADLRQALAAHTETGNKLHVPYFQGLLAELEAEAEGADGALARIDAALAVAAETGELWTDAFLHRIHGEILLKRDPANTAPVEEAFLTAIAIAQQQKAKSFELCAALSLAKLYQSTNRPADAHAVLAPALEGFSPTPEFSEIAEAQTLLATLSETEEVKNAKVSRR